MYSALVAHLARVSQMANAFKVGGAGVVAGGVSSTIDFKDNPLLNVTALGVWGLKSIYNGIFGEEKSVDVNQNISEISDYYAKKREAQIIETQKEFLKVKEENNNSSSGSIDKKQDNISSLTLLSLLDKQNSILQKMALNLAIQNLKDNDISVGSVENINREPLTIKGRVVNDGKGHWLDPITQKLYDPITGLRISENGLSSSNSFSGGVSADVNFKEVLKSQTNINSEISKYISTIGENQKVYNQNLEKLVINSKEYSKAMKDGLAGVQLNASVDVNNKLNASLAINKPVEISFPASYAENQKILSENSTKTLEIYKEKAEYDKTSVAIKDLDGNTIIKASPREIALSRQAVQARTYTDENNFELDNEALDLFDFPMPNFKDLFDTELPSKTLLKDVK
ncbi:hypothetical protein [Campylobacter concisus]|uniref:hypothetical protein n=1 Tax=Campylobacter concisus TaxID=199 RepID=UPI0011E67F45|nr:hypothetical protein [Campylobacter concisus]